jgi:hypothetical protein
MMYTTREKYKTKVKCDEIHLTPYPMKNAIYSKKFYHPYPMSKINQLQE